MTEKDVVDVEIVQPGRVKKFDPDKKNVTSASLSLGSLDEWDNDCTLVEPGHPTITQRANIDPFAMSNNEWEEREQHLFKLMHDNLGVGLAANQVGMRYNMFVMTHSHLGDIGVYKPKILETGEDIIQIEEGCLTWPLLFIRLKRAEKIKVTYTKTDGETKVETWMDGMDARCFLHEYDHLQGINFIDLAGDLQLKRAKAKRDKYFKKMERKIKKKR